MTSSAAPTVHLKPGLTLYLVRHGETDWNRDARYQGQRDIPLNETGRAQARAYGEKLKASGYALTSCAFVSSPLARAVETMQLMRGALGLDAGSFTLEPELKELNYGHWEGQLASDLRHSDADAVAAKTRDPFAWRPDGGESYADLTARVSRWLASLQSDTVAVTHGGVSRVARGALLGLPPASVPFLEVPQDRILILRDGSMTWL